MFNLSFFNRRAPSAEAVIETTPRKTAPTEVVVRPTPKDCRVSPQERNVLLESYVGDRGDFESEWAYADIWLPDGNGITIEIRNVREERISEDGVPQRCNGLVILYQNRDRKFDPVGEPDIIARVMEEESLDDYIMSIQPADGRDIYKDVAMEFFLGALDRIRTEGNKVDLGDSELCRDLKRAYRNKVSGDPSWNRMYESAGDE